MENTPNIKDPSFYLTLSFQDFQKTEHEPLDKTLYFCVLSLENKNFIEFSQTVQFNEPSNEISKPSFPEECLLKLSIRSPESGSLGSVSIPADIFFKERGIQESFSQWFFLIIYVS